jgi:hypothetical protein
MEVFDVCALVIGAGLLLALLRLGPKGIEAAAWRVRMRMFLSSESPDLLERFERGEANEWREWPEPREAAEGEEWKNG